MALKELINEIRAKAQRDANSLEKAAAEADAEVDKARKEKKELVEAAKKDAERIVENERNEIIASARLKAKQMNSKAKETAVNAALEEVWKELLNLRKDSSYAKVMKKLIAEGEKELGAGTVVLVRKEDKKFASGSKEAEISGGAIIQTKDEKISVNNSFEAIFEESQDELRKELYAKMFGG
ncbi:MAG: V-type ATP synthase subunit E [Candidatus Diapherotrites archaeon]